MFNSLYITSWHTSSLSGTPGLTRNDSVHLACFGVVNHVEAPAILRSVTEAMSPWSEMEVFTIDSARIFVHKLEILLAHR